MNKQYSPLTILLHNIVSHIALNQSAASMTLYKSRYSFPHFILATILEKC